MNAEHVHRVFEHLWTSGQLSKADIAALPGMGFEVVINLALPTSANALPGEADLVTEQGMAYVQIPVQWENPKPEQFAEFVGVLAAFRGRKIWVHCAKNMRVSAFIYLYRKLVLHEDDAHASFPMHEVWRPNDIWQAFIDQVCAAHPGRVAQAGHPAPHKDQST